MSGKTKGASTHLNKVNKKVVNNKVDNKNKDGINKEDKNSEKYKIALKFVNKILSNLGKPEIDDLTGFKDINRDDIIKDVNKTTYNEMEKELLKHFDKKKMAWYRRNTDSHYILTFLKCMITDLGYNFDYVQKDIYIQNDGNKFRKTCMFYSIK